MKKIRMFLPAIAIMFAVAGALATNASPKSFADFDVSLDDDPCAKIGRCINTETTSIVCEVNAGFQLYKVQTPTCPEVINGTLGEYDPE
jgi:hypothetical protein